MTRTGRKPEVGLELRHCLACGTEFQPYRSHQVACSRKCREQTREQSPRRKLYELQCGICGLDFQAMWTGMGRQPSCDPCTESMRLANQYRKNVARRLETSADPVARREINLRSALLRYGLTADEYRAMLTAQDSKCAICGGGPAGGIKAAARLHVDHDHDTGKVRALLCNGCNRGIGYLKDDPALLRVAADYIEQHKGERNGTRG